MSEGWGVVKVDTAGIGKAAEAIRDIYLAVTSAKRAVRDGAAAAAVTRMAAEADSDALITRTQAELQVARIRKMEEQRDQTIATPALEAQTAVPEVADRTELLERASDDELRERASKRLLALEIARQRSIEAITLEALQSLPPGADGEKPPEDWISRFFVEAQDVTDEQMLQVWGRLFAAEVQHPLSVSRRTLSRVRDLDPRDLANFEIVRPYVMSKDDESLILSPTLAPDFMETTGLRRSRMLALEEAGLLIASLEPRNIADLPAFVLCNRRVSIVHREVGHFQFNWACYVFTRAGHELHKALPTPSLERRLGMERYLTALYENNETRSIYFAPELDELWNASTAMGGAGAP